MNKTEKAITLTLGLTLGVILIYLWSWLFQYVLSLFGWHFEVWQCFLIWLVITSVFKAARGRRNNPRGNHRTRSGKCWWEGKLPPVIAVPGTYNKTTAPTRMLADSGNR